jgi:uncharacterized protein (DUF1501 family)
MRGALAFHPPGSGEDSVIDLNGFYGLHPSLEPLLPFYKQGQLAVIHAAATPYRERSHFDAQNLLENGTTSPGGTNGWLNRALASLGAGEGTAMAINQQVPLVLQGQIGVASWSPKGGKFNETSDYMRKMQSLYQSDALFSPAFHEGMKAQEMAESSMPADDQMAGGKAKPAAQLQGAAQAAAMFLARQDGPRVAVLEASGWDTHAGQGTLHGPLANRLNDLAQALAGLPQGLGPVWDKTVVVVVTEFGRTVHINGTGGTDHGTGGMMMVMGGGSRIRGGNVYAQWPGLGENALYQGRDLMPTIDARSVFRTVLYSHMRASSDALNNIIFPDSATVPYLRQLIA